MIKTLGQEAGYGPAVGQGGDPVVTFVVDAIEVDPGCSDGAVGAATQGHFVIVSLRLSSASNAGGSNFFDYGDWHIIGPDGVRENSNDSVESFSCVAEANRFPQGPLTPGVQLVGQFGLDTRHTSGFLIYTPPFMTGGGGWEWSF